MITFSVDAGGAIRQMAIESERFVDDEVAPELKKFAQQVLRSIQEEVSSPVIDNHDHMNKCPSKVV